ncbi:MAG: hypothetical protein H7Y42_08740 [Chitinophagaceae bacterium]|nr:hypothetical protein [Chitinophagaceae bacterium]
MGKNRVVILRLIVVFVFLSLGKTSFGQNGQATTLTIDSKIIGEKRNIIVRVPADYERGSEMYPVVYMLDGRAPLINLMTGTIEHLVWSDLVPEMILVMISNTDRGRDMTPTRVASQPGSGGADNFQRFLETELIPLIEKSYRVQPYKILAGHSLSGLFVTYSFVSRPGVFNAYLAASPFLQWDNGFVLKKGAELLKSRQELKSTLFFALGNEPQFLNGFSEFRDLLDRLHLKGLDHEFVQLQEENHWSTISTVFHKGLRKVWSDLKRWELPSNPGFSLLDLENHYKALHQKYGYATAIPERQLNALGYRHLESGKIAEAVAAFEMNMRLYPASVNVYDSYADALEKKGQFREAKTNLEIALKLAEAANNTQRATVIKERIAKLTLK